MTARQALGVQEGRAQGWGPRAGPAGLQGSVWQAMLAREEGLPAHPATQPCLLPRPPGDSLTLQEGRGSTRLGSRRRDAELSMTAPCSPYSRPPTPNLAERGLRQETHPLPLWPAEGPLSGQRGDTGPLPSTVLAVLVSA